MGASLNIANISSNKTPPIPHAIPNIFNLIHCLESMFHYNGFAAEPEKSFKVPMKNSKAPLSI